MGKRDSYLFCRMHDIKYALKQQKHSAMEFVPFVMPEVMERFVAEHPDFPENNAILALVSYVSIDDIDLRNRDLPQRALYDNNMVKAGLAVLDHRDYMIKAIGIGQSRRERDAQYLNILICYGFMDKLPEMKKIAVTYLNLILDLEEHGVDVRAEEYIWISLALACGFEEWHDQEFGNPIIGPSEYARDQDSGTEFPELKSEDIYQIREVKVIFKEPVDLTYRVVPRFVDTCLRFGLECTKKPTVYSRGNARIVSFTLSNGDHYGLVSIDGKTFSLGYLQMQDSRWSEDRIVDFQMALCICLMQVGPFDYQSSTGKAGQGQPKFSWTAFENRVRGQR